MLAAKNKADIELTTHLQQKTQVETMILRKVEW